MVNGEWSMNGRLPCSLSHPTSSVHPFICSSVHPFFRSSVLLFIRSSVLLFFLTDMPLACPYTFFTPQTLPIAYCPLPIDFCSFPDPSYFPSRFTAMSYQPGTHLIATLHTDQTSALEECSSFRQVIDTLISDHDLQKLGEVYHNFSPAGYTGVVCLSESHLSIHTWPEHGRINVDIYLSNYLRNNDGTVDRIYDAIKKHFNASVENETFLKR
jgi:S-adenosylmethionine decarboxylase